MKFFALLGEQFFNSRKEKIQAFFLLEINTSYTVSYRNVFCVFTRCPYQGGKATKT